MAMREAMQEVVSSLSVIGFVYPVKISLSKATRLTRTDFQGSKLFQGVPFVNR